MWPTWTRPTASGSRTRRCRGPACRWVGIEARTASPVPIATVSLWRDDRWLEHRAVTGDRIDVFFTDAPEPREHHYVVRAQSIAGELPVGPQVAYSSPTYVRSDSAGGGSV